MSLFDNIDTDSSKQDNIDSASLNHPENFMNYAEEVDVYKKRGFLETGNLLGMKSNTPNGVPGWVGILKQLYANNWDCVQSVSNFKPESTAIAYELKDYFANESSTDKLSAICVSEESGQWIISDEIANDYQKFEFLTNQIVAVPAGKRYHIYVPTNKFKCWEEDEVDAPALKFAGVYELDKARSLFYRKVIMKRADTRINFPIL